MKKKVIIWGIIMSVLFSGCSPSISENTQTQKSQTAVKEENPDFRNCNWGMTKDEVKKHETDIEIIEENEDEIKAKVEINNIDFYAGYYFNNDKLEQVSMEEHSNENLYIDDYEKFPKLISEKYGEPKLNEKVWNDDLYKDRPSDWGFAISLGELSMISQWLTDTTEVGLTLTGDNYNIVFGIVYMDINYENQADTSGL